MIRALTAPVGLFRLLWLLGLCCATAAQAVQLERLYEAEVPARDQTPEERQIGLRTALAEVLVRVSGDQTLLAHPSVAALLETPGRFVQQYRYVQVPVADPTETPDDLATDIGLGEDPPLPWRLWVRFDAAGLERALRDRGLPFWGGERPATLVWLALEEGGRRSLIGELDEADSKAWVFEAAERRGLPLVFPLMDLEDRANVRFSDVWGGFLDPLASASQRYRPQALLVGRVHQDRAGGWRGNWTLRVQGAEHQWSFSHPQRRALLAAGVDRAADELAAVFAVQDSDVAGDFVVITIDGVASLADYARLNRYFASLTAVETVQLVRLDGQQAAYQLQLQGDVQGLDRALSIGNVLAPQAADGETGYRLLP